MLGITIKESIGVGDKVQFSSLPENYYNATGAKLVDVSRCWIFDHNPYVSRDERSNPTKIVELWNFGPRQWQWPVPREAWQPKVYYSNAEIWASLFNVPVSLNRPRLYRYEEFPFKQREKILLQVEGKSHGRLPDKIIDHVLKKYGSENALYTIGVENPGLPVPHIETPTLWDLARLISTCRMLIAPDSGPAWIGSCYPDVVVKKVRTRPVGDRLKIHTPLEIANIHSHWDDRCQFIFNTTDRDIGFTQSYLRI